MGLLIDDKLLAQRIQAWRSNTVTKEMLAQAKRLAARVSVPDGPYNQAVGAYCHGYLMGRLHQIEWMENVFGYLPEEDDG